MFVPGISDVILAVRIKFKKISGNWSRVKTAPPEIRSSISQEFSCRF
jgi:hypothetical protein